MNWRTYAEYRRSGVDWLGDLPAHWRTKPLWSMFTRVKQTGFPDEEMLSVYREHGVVVKDSRDDNLNKTAEDRNIYQLVGPGWLITNRMKAWQGSVGISSHRGIVSGHYICFRPQHDEVGAYLNWLLRSSRYVDGYQTLSRGVRPGQAEIDNDMLRSLPVVVPPTEEQLAITQFLEFEVAKIDALIGKQEQLIATLREHRTATITYAVTNGLLSGVEVRQSGVEWLGRIPAHWGATRLRFVCDIQTGDKDTVNRVDGGEYPFFVRSQTIEAIDGYSFDCEAVLTAGDGAGVGKVFHYFNGRFDAHQRVYVFNNFREVKGRFFYYYFSALLAVVALDGGAKSTVDSLRRPLLANFPMTVPPPDEQAEIIRYLDLQNQRIDSLIAKAASVIHVLREYRSVLITDAVTGKIDVREAG